MKLTIHEGQASSRKIRRDEALWSVGKEIDFSENKGKQYPPVFVLHALCNQKLEES